MNIVYESRCGRSEIYFLELDRDVVPTEARLLEDLHEFLSCLLLIGLEFCLIKHGGFSVQGNFLLTCLHPLKKELVLFVGFEGIEDLGLLIEEAIHHLSSNTIVCRRRIHAKIILLYQLSFIILKQIFSPEKPMAKIKPYHQLSTI